MRSIALLLFGILCTYQVYAQDWNNQFLTLYEDGDDFFYAYDYSEALLNFEEAYRIAKNELAANEIYKSGFAVVITLRKLIRYKEAYLVLRELLDNVGEQFSPSQNIYVYQYLGLINTSIAKYERAISEFDTAISFAKLSRDTLLIGTLLVNKSISLIHQNRLNIALENLDLASSFSIKDDIFNSFLNQTYYNVYTYRNEHKKGFPFLLKAYEFAKESNDRPRYMMVLTNLSNYYLRQNNFREGLTLFQEGYSIAKETKSISTIAQFSDYLGRAYKNLGDTELAIKYYNEALKIYEQSENEHLSNSLKIQIAKLFITDGELETAHKLLKPLLNEKLSILQKVFVYSSLSDIEREKKDYQAAKAFIEMALSELDESTQTFSIDLYDRLLSLPIISNEEKIEYAVIANKKAGSKSVLSKINSEIDLAITYEPVNQDSAFKYAYLAFNRIEKHRYRIFSPSIKNKMNNKWQDFYYELAHWEVKYHENYDRAFELFELSKSRSLFDQMYENQQAKLFSPDDPESVHILSLQKRIDQWYEQINGESSLSTHTAHILKISELELEYQISLDAYMNSNSDLTDLRYPTVTTLEEVQSLLNSETAYLSYGVRKNSLFIFLITKENNVFKEVVLKDDAQKVLSSEVNNFRNAIINLEDLESITSLSNQLIDQIFSPIISHLDGIKHLVISPDGPLHLLSFEALVIEEQYLIEKFSIKYLPSFSIYTSIKYPKVKDFEYELLAIAGSGFESGDKNLIHGSQKSYATLPYSLAEVDSIHNYFETSTILKNEDVTEYAFKNLNLSDYRYIHLATHGELDEFFPNQSGLILSNKRNSESIFGEDGFLTAREIAQLDLSADLITLSACNTGTGKVINGEGVMGLQRAILAAGAASVIVSLWNIYDRSTPIFMNTFYRQMHEFEDKETSVIDRFKMYIDYYEPELIDYKTLALQQTKIDMIHHPFYNQPVHWAPFILIGK